MENYNLVKNMKDWNSIHRYEVSRKRFKRDQNRYTTSFKLLQGMVNQLNNDPINSIVVQITEKYLHSDVFNHIMQYVDSGIPVLRKIRFDNSNIAASPYRNTIDPIIENLNFFTNKCSRKIEIPETTDDVDYEVLSFDFETCSNTKHAAYLVCCYNERRQDVYYGSDCGKQLLDSIDRHTILIAHNASYDYRFLVKHLQNNCELSRGNNLIVSKSTYNGFKIIIKDSYKLITSPLRDFPKTFNLGDIEKEVMPYKLYTEENIKKQFVPISEALSCLEEHQKSQFIKNIETWNLKRDDDTYDIIEYSKRYCEIDCIVLYRGYFVFRSWILEQLNLDINNILTVASLADQYLKKQHCYDDVYELSGIIRMFIEKCIVGGRVMTANNEKIIIRESENRETDDFDAVSLYPSAMVRLYGFLKGKPKVLKDLSMDFLNSCDGYFIEIKITKIGKKRAFPITNFKNGNGVRLFTNDCEGRTMYVDKITLEDLIEFQDVSFTILRGYYFNEGFNDKIKEVIQFLFQKRLELKSVGNKAEMIYKLIMNSSYGRNLMKAVEHETHVFYNKKDYEIFESRNYNNIYESICFGKNCYKVKTYKSILDHFSSPHIGCNILSMSKRIMNEVMTLAEDNNISIFYQDTDSMHIPHNDIPTLNKLFKSKYNRELIGKNMGQFHTDFSLKDENGKPCKNITAVACIFNGKKCYIDKLKGYNNDGDIVYDNGTKCGKSSFMISKGHNIESRSKFTRKIQF